MRFVQAIGLKSLWPAHKFAALGSDRNFVLQRSRLQRAKPAAPAVGRNTSADNQSEIAAIFASCRNVLWALGLFSGLSNLLMLTGSFFMLQVYDRVLPSRSVPTLVVLAALAAALYTFQGALDYIRNRICVRLGTHFDEVLSLRVYDALIVLDEPNSNLDSDGENALTHAILGVRARGGIVVIIAHRPSALVSVDHVLVMREGRHQAFGTKEEVLGTVPQQSVSSQATSYMVAETYRTA